MRLSDGRVITQQSRCSLQALAMVTSLSEQDPARWAASNFSGARMRDRRRKQRLRTIAAAMAAKPGASIPQLFRSPHQIKAAYAFFGRPEAAPDAIQAGHRKLALEAARQSGRTVLFIEDATELTWPGNQPVPGLGPIGSFGEGLQGFMLQSVLAADWPGAERAPTGARRPAMQILGLADQQYHVRKRRPADKPKGDARARTKREFESELWDRSLRRIGPPPEGARWVRVCDRGADIYETLEATPRMGWGFVIRAAHDRCLLEESGRKAGALFEAARSAPILGGLELELRARPGRPARTARLKVAAKPVTIRSTSRPGKPAGTLPSIECWVVRVFEPDPPDPKQALEWILLSDAPAPDLEPALEVVSQYVARWAIEDFHKALKSGLGAERLQLETAQRLFAAISIMSVAALRLIDLRERTRIRPEAPAEESGLNETELKILRVHLKRPIRTVRETALAIGRLGGHMNRKADGMPGWQTLWLGMTRLADLYQGYLTAIEVIESG